MKTIWLMIVPIILLGCTTPVNAPVSVDPVVQPGAVVVESGLVSPGAVRVDPNAVRVEVLENVKSVNPQLAAIIRNSDQRADGQAYADTQGDSSQNVVTVSLDGSGWPLVGVGVVCVGAVVGWWYYRRKAGMTSGWLADIASQVQRLPADQKKNIIDRISGRVRDEKRLKSWLTLRGLRADKPKDS